MNNWNDDRVALLKKLWAEGHSCSRIAARMGGLTRNAVIGKVTRLGLVRRSHVTVKRKPMKPRLATVPQTRMQELMAGHGSASPAKPKPRTFVVNNPNEANFPAAERKPVEPYREMPASYVPPAEQMVTMLDLDEHHCRFPIGDPRSESFKFCGGKRQPGTSYCVPHLHVAYVPKINGKGAPVRQDGVQLEIRPSGKVEAEAAPGRKLEDA